MTSATPDKPTPSFDSALSVVPGVEGVPTGPRKPPPRRKALSVDEYVAGVLANDRVVVGRALSLVESSNPDHRPTAMAVLERLQPHAGRSIRLGISGVPGVGKSTFIEALGTRLANAGERIAVLAIDPSSDISGGSILGDKTRMNELSRHQNALVRPTATGSWLGGVARTTREAIMVVEAAGYGLVIVETVGVGQSETSVASMVDTFLLLMLAGAGDELQGIKRGILEVADIVAINKADGDNVGPAMAARAQLSGAMRLMRGIGEGWQPRVLTCSALTGAGLDELWSLVCEHHAWLVEDGRLARRRGQQALFWMKQAIDYLLNERFTRSPAVRERRLQLEEKVLNHEVSPFAAAEELVRLAMGGDKDWGSGMSTHEGASREETAPDTSEQPRTTNQ